MGSRKEEDSPCCYSRLSINIGLQRLRTQNCLNGHFGTLLTLESRKRLRKYLAEMASGVITISMTSRGILSALWPNIEIEKWTNWQFGIFFAKWMVSLPTYWTTNINIGQMNSHYLRVTNTFITKIITILIPLILDSYHSVLNQSQLVLLSHTPTFQQLIAKWHSWIFWFFFHIDSDHQMNSITIWEWSIELLMLPLLTYHS